MIELCISGMQTGADIAGVRAAKLSGIPTSGWMPKGYNKTEDGPRPDYATLYNAREHASPLYPPRTHANAAWADATLWFGRGDSAGFGCTAGGCRKAGKPIWTCLGPDSRPAIDTALLVRSMGYKVLNVAGGRESKNPGIEMWVGMYLMELFSILKGDAPS